MVVPAAVVELDESDPSLDQPPGQQAIVGKGGNPGLSAVLLQNLRGLLAGVHQVGNTGLHPVGHLEGLDPRRDVGIADRIHLEAVEIPQPVQQVAPRGRGDAPGVGDKKDGLSPGAKLDSLVAAGQKAVAPVAGQQGLTLAAPRSQNHEGRQLTVFAAQAVREPGAHGGTSRLLSPRLDQGHGRIVVDGVGMHRANDGQVVGYAGRVRQ